MTNAQKEFNEWNIAKLEGMIEGLMAQRTITKEVCQRLKELLHDIETYTHRLENEIKTSESNTIAIG